MSEQALAVTEETGELIPLTPDNYIAMAIEKGTDLDQLERLMNLKERYDAGEAKKAFFEAMGEFQSIVPTLKKTSKVEFGQTNYSFASLGAIAEQIRESLKLCGLSYRFEQNHESGIEVSCIVTHVAGHSESTSMKAPADDSGKKNSIQGIGSTVTYLQRYTLISALGLTTADQDIDAKVALATGDTLDVNQISLVEKACESQKRDLNKLLNWIGVSRVKDIPQKDWGRICNALGMENQ